jgi:hypothetical protein
MGCTIGCIVSFGWGCAACIPVTVASIIEAGVYDEMFSQDPPIPPDPGKDCDPDVDPDGCPSCEIETCEDGLPPLSDCTCPETCPPGSSCS